MEKNKIEFDSQLNKEDLKIIYYAYTHLKKTDIIVGIFIVYLIIINIYYYFAKINQEYILPLSVYVLLIILLKVYFLWLFYKKFNSVKKFKICNSLLFINGVEVEHYKDIIISENFLFFKNPIKVKVVKIPPILKNNLIDILSEQNISFRVIDNTFSLTAYRLNKI